MSGNPPPQSPSATGNRRQKSFDSSTFANDGPRFDPNSDIKEQNYIYDNPNDLALNEKSNNSNSSLILDFLKQLKPGMEIYRIAVPTYLIQPVSLLEKIASSTTPTKLMLE